jgi:neutral trehalase
MHYNFLTVAVRGTEEDLQRWKSEAALRGEKLADYLRSRIDGVFFDNSVRLIERSNVRTTPAAPDARTVRGE